MSGGVLVSGGSGCCSEVVYLCHYCISRCFSILLTAFLLVWYVKKKLVLRAYMRVSVLVHLLLLLLLCP